MLLPNRETRRKQSPTTYATPLTTRRQSKSNQKNDRDSKLGEQIFYRRVNEKHFANVSANCRLDKPSSRTIAPSCEVAPKRKRQKGATFLSVQGLELFYTAKRIAQGETLKNFQKISLFRRVAYFNAFNDFSGLPSTALFSRRFFARQARFLGRFFKGPASFLPLIIIAPRKTLKNLLERRRFGRVRS